jgi:putative transcriptional regulator
MSKLGTRLMQSAQEALAYATGGATEGFAVHTPIDVRAIRGKLQLAQPEFAARFGLSLGTLRDWEQGRSVPDRPAQVLLRVIEAEPGLVQRVVASVQDRAATETGSTGSAAAPESPPAAARHAARPAS